MFLEGPGQILLFHSHHSGIASISRVRLQHDSGFGELPCHDPVRLCPKGEEMSPHIEAQAIEGMGICHGTALT